MIATARIHVYAILVFAVLVAHASTALAAAPSRGAYAAVGGRCQGDLRRLCPDLATSLSGRDQAICLKPYRTSLSLPCRGAVRAVAR